MSELHSFPIRGGLLAALLATALGASSCLDGGGTGPSSKNPIVEVTLPSSNVIGGTIDVTMSVSRCDSVKSAALYDGTRLIRTFSFTTNPITLTLTTADIPFSQDRMAAQLSLVASIVCSDDRKGSSLPASAIFLPVAESFVGTQSGPVVPLFFFADGSGVSTTFVGCNYLANGTRQLIRVSRQGNILATIDRADVQCDYSAQFTDPAGGVRWMLVPGVGALAFDFNLHVTSVARSPWTNAEDPVAGNTIVINPVDGDAIIYWAPTEGQNNLRSTIYRVRSHCLGGGGNCPAGGIGVVDAPVVWNVQPGGPGGGTSDEPFQLLGDPFVAYGSGTGLNQTWVILPGFFNDVATRTARHQLRALDYVDGHENPDGLLELTGSNITYGIGDRPRTHVMDINITSHRVYLPFVTKFDANGAAVASEIRAYDGNGVEATKTSPSFGVEIFRALPFANETRIAAIGAKEIYFLDAADLSVLNPGSSVKAKSGYQILYIEKGHAQDIYVMTGPAPANEGDVPLAKELITFISPSEPEVVRYPIGVGSLVVSVDAGGDVWMRAGNSLHRLLPFSDYLRLKLQ